MVGSPTAPGGAVSGANMVSVPWMSHCGPGERSRSGYHVVVAALEDCNPDYRRGVVTVCRWGGEVVVWGAEAGGAEGSVAVWCGGLFPLLRAVRVRWVARLRWGPS